MDATKLVRSDLQQFIGGKITFFQFVPNKKFRGTIQEIILVNGILLIKFGDKEKDPGGTVAATNQWEVIEPKDLDIRLSEFVVTELSHHKVALHSEKHSSYITFCAPIPHQRLAKC